jgi:hypothetical protein
MTEEQGKQAIAQYRELSAYLHCRHPGDMVRALIPMLTHRPVEGQHELISLVLELEATTGENLQEWKALLFEQHVSLKHTLEQRVVPAFLHRTWTGTKGFTSYSRADGERVTLVAAGSRSTVSEDNTSRALSASGVRPTAASTQGVVVKQSVPMASSVSSSVLRMARPPSSCFQLSSQKRIWRKLGVSSVDDHADEELGNTSNGASAAPASAREEATIEGDSALSLPGQISAMYRFELSSPTTLQVLVSQPASPV